MITLPRVLYKQRFQSYGERYWEQLLLCYAFTSNTIFPSYEEQCKSASADYDIDGIDTYFYWKLKFDMMILSKYSPTYEESHVINHSSTNLQNDSTTKSAILTHCIQTKIAPTTNQQQFISSTVLTPTSSIIV